MAATAVHPAKRTDEDFEPFCKWHNRDNIVVEVHLQGFRKEHLSVRTTYSDGDAYNPYMENVRWAKLIKSTWSRFHKEFKLPNNCDTDRVAAKFAAGVLTITMPPKVVAPAPPHKDDDQKRHADNEKLPLPSHVDNQTNNDEAVGKIIKQKQDDNATKDENAALLDQEVKQGSSSCQFRQSLTSKKLIAAKLVMVVAAVVAFGIGAYVRYKQGHHSYSSLKID